MRDAIGEMFQSKKFLAAAGASIAWLLVRLGAKYGITIDAEIAVGWADKIVYCAMTYIGGQAVADFGKSAKNGTTNGK